MARKKAETASQPEQTVVIQPDGSRRRFIFDDKTDLLAYNMFIQQDPGIPKDVVEFMTAYVRQGIIQLDMPVNGIELNETQKKIRELWFKDSTEEAVREQVLGSERYQFWKQTGSMEPPPPPKKEEEAASPASENKGEADSTVVNVEVNDNSSEKKEEESQMFNQQNNNNGQQQAQPNNQNQQQNSGNFITDAIGAVDNFTDHWYGKAVIAGAAAAGTYYLMNRAQNSDPDYSSAGDDAVGEYGGNFF